MSEYRIDRMIDEFGEFFTLKRRVSFWKFSFWMMFEPGYWNTRKEAEQRVEELKSGSKPTPFKLWS